MYRVKTLVIKLLIVFISFIKQKIIKLEKEIAQNMQEWEKLND